MKSNTFDGIEYILDETTNLVQKHAKHYVSESEELKRYDTHHNTLEDNRYIKYFNTIISQFIEPNLKAGTILDFGSGQAKILAYLMTDKPVFSYDLFYFPETNLLKVKYDNIVLIETVEHFQDPLHYFKLLTSMLNQHGRLIIQTLFKPDLSEFGDWWYVRDNTHVSFYDLKVFKYLATKLNLEIIYTNNKNEIVLKKI